MNRSIRTTAVYILNDFKRVYNRIYFDLFILTRENFRAADLMINDIRLIKNFQINVSFDNDFVENSLIIVSRIDIIETDTSTSATRTVVFKFLILKIVFVISRKTSQVEKINQLNKLNVVSSAVNSVFFKYNFSILIKRYSFLLSIKTVNLPNMNFRLSSIKTL